METSVQCMHVPWIYSFLFIPYLLLVSLYLFVLLDFANPLVGSTICQSCSLYLHWREDLCSYWFLSNQRHNLLDTLYISASTSIFYFLSFSFFSLSKANIPDTMNIMSICREIYSVFPQVWKLGQHRAMIGGSALARIAPKSRVTPVTETNDWPSLAAWGLRDQSVTTLDDVNWTIVLIIIMII